MFSFRILGPLGVFEGDRSAPVPPGLQRSLLALLLIEARRTVRTDAIVAALWPEDSLPTDPANAVQGLVSRLRKLTTKGTTTLLQKRQGGYVLEATAEDIDAQRFEQLADLGRQALARGDHEAAVEKFSQGLDLWRGAALEDARDAPWATVEIQRLEEQRLTVLEDQVTAELGLGRHSALIVQLQELVADNPFRERLRGQLMLALYRGGRQADALTVYGEGHQLLLEELGIEPEARLRQLHRKVLEQSPELDWRPKHPMVKADRSGSPVSPDDREDTAMIGRSAHLRSLASACEQTRKGRGAVALITGEAGVGKSHLVTAFAATTSAAGVAVRWGCCFEHEGAPPFWPWVQMLRGMVDELDDAALRRTMGSGAAQLAQLLPEVVERLGINRPPASGDPAQNRFRLYDAVSRFVGRVAVERPLALILEDIHWADTPSLELLAVLASYLRTIPLLLVATYRDGDAGRDGNLDETLTRLAREPVVHRHHLRGLSPEDVSHFVARHPAVTPSAGLATAIHERTGGNPFFVSELLTLLDGSDGSLGASGAQLLSDAVPSGIREVIERRLGALPAATRTALEGAAVTGRRFRIPTAAAGASLSGVDLLAALDPAVTAGIVVPDEESASTYRFSHALVRDTIYAGMPGASRVQMHARIGEVLEVSGDARHLAQVAHHYEQAAPMGMAGRAADAGLRAAGHAEQSLAFEQAAQHLRKALHVLDGEGAHAARELEVRSRLVHLLLETGGYASPEVYGVAGEVRTLAAGLDAAPHVLGLTWALWVHTCVRAEFDHALRIADDLIRDGDHARDTAAVAAGRQARGTTLWHLGRIEDAADQLTEGLDGFADLGPDELRGRGLQHAAVLAGCHTVHPLWLLGRDAEAERHLANATRLARLLDDPYEAVFCQLFTAWLATLRGDADAAWHDAHRAELASDAHGFALLGALAGCLAGWAQAVRGDLTGGVDRIEEALRAAEATGARMLRHFHLGLLADAHHRNGQDAAAAIAVQEAVQASRSTGEAFHLPALETLTRQLEGRR